MNFALSLGDFYGIDSLVEFMIVLVSFFISYYSYRVYKLVREKNYRLFSFAFLSIGISFIFKILSNLTLIHRIVVENANFIYVIWRDFQYIQLINFFSFIGYKVFNVIGFLLLFLILKKTGDKEENFLFVYLSLIVVFLSIYFNFTFYLTLALILFFLTEYFYQNHRKIRSRNSFLVFFGFLIIFIAQLSFLFLGFHRIFYLAGEILYLIGFLSLLLNQINLKRNFKNETKTNKVRSNKRSFRNLAKK